VIGEFQRRRAGAALLAVDDDEIGANFRLQHRLADRQEFPGVADAELEADRLAARQGAQSRDEIHHLDRRREFAVARRRQAVPAGFDAADRGDFLRDLGARSTPP
jgi:hypothetical protein